ncbi:MAG TPA: cation:proton antiporter [Dehalococcoidia bacterium]|nr:cation:proton antiporter [Dehalococcoidia bacterium]
MPDTGLVGLLAVVLAAALAGGTVAHLLGLPPLLGYLLAGLLLGPYTPGPVAEVDQVQRLADVGVALLMFGLGLQLSLRGLREVGAVAIGGGLLQVGAVIGLGMLLGSAFGLGMAQSLVAGWALASSSTTIALRLLEERGEVDSVHGRVAAAVSMVQDLSLVPLLVAMPALGGDGGPLGTTLALTVAKAAAFLAGTYLLATRAVPWAMLLLAGRRSREMFLLGTVVLALGGTALGALTGLSPAFGAFLAGLVLAESDHAQQGLAEMLPLRNVFAALFFVAMGMLLDPHTLVEAPSEVMAFTLLGSVGKGAIVVALALAFGYLPRTAFLSGLLLAQTGEFAFLAVSVADDEGVLDERAASALLGSAFISLLLAPLALRWGASLADALLRSSPPARVGLPAGETLVNHVVVCGLGEAGAELVTALRRRGFRCVVIEQDPVAVRWLQQQGVPYVHGEPSSPLVLEQAQIGRARVLAVVQADPASAEAVVAAARRMAPEVDIVARGAGPESHRSLRALGADEVVHPGFEAGLEFVRHTLHRLGVSSAEVQAYLQRRRRDYYAPD